MAERRGLARGCSCISVIVSSSACRCKLSRILITMLVSNQVASGCSVLKNWGIHSIAELSTVQEVYICGAEKRNTGRVRIFRVFCRAARPSMQTLCWEESDSTVVVTAKIGELVELFSQ